MSSGGGKSGKNTEQTDRDIPDWLKQPAIRNLQRAEDVQRIEYMPYRGAEIAASGPFYVELILNPTITIAANWLNVGGTSLAQYAVLNINSELVGGEVIYGFYADAGVAAYDLSRVKEISNSILGGGTGQLSVASGSNPTGVFPDGPEVLAVQVTNIAGGRGSNNRYADARFSWTEAQA